MKGTVFALLLFVGCADAQGPSTLTQRAQHYLVELVRINTSNPPGNETRAAEYLKQAATANGIAAELVGDKAARLNFIARLPATRRGTEKPLLLMAHSDVVPADPSQWTVPAFSAETRDGYIYGRGTQDDKSLLAAELAVLVELKLRNVPLRRDIVLLSEADEEAGSIGMSWLVQNAWEKIDAEFALNEGGDAFDTQGGVRVFQIQTSEKIPTRIVLTARGTAGHGSLPRPDNAVVHLARALTRLVDFAEPVELNATTRQYLNDIAKLHDYQWLQPMLPRLESKATAAAAANEIGARDAELNAMLRTSVSPTMLQAGMKVNVIPNQAVAHVDVRRLPNETRQEVEARFRAVINDPEVTVAPEGGQDMPATEPSSMSTLLYMTLEKVFKQSRANALVVPFMSRGATDGSFLRQKGMAVYGVPIFVRDGESRAHGNDERISAENLAQGTEQLYKIVTSIAAGN